MISPEDYVWLLNIYFFCFIFYIGEPGNDHSRAVSASYWGFWKVLVPIKMDEVYFL